MRGNRVETERKVWIQHFLVDKESGMGKSDFGFKLRIIEETSYAMREWMKEDLLVELWETRPRVIERKNEDESVVKEV